jgi:hypothetical protein
MNDKKTLFLKYGKAGIVLNAVLLLALTGCVGYVDGPHAEVAVAAPAVVVQDDYLYYPSYGIYYSSSRQQYASLDAGAWVSEPAPRGVSVDVLLASPSVRMDFHDSPANHHAAVARQYPRNWKPARSKQKTVGSNEHGEK